VSFSYEATGERAGLIGRRWSRTGPGGRSLGKAPVRVVASCRRIGVGSMAGAVAIDRGSCGVPGCGGIGRRIGAMVWKSPGLSFKRWQAKPCHPRRVRLGYFPAWDLGGAPTAEQELGARESCSWSRHNFCRIPVHVEFASNNGGSVHQPTECEERQTSHRIRMLRIVPSKVAIA
jgi:hypothetical protein